MRLVTIVRLETTDEGTFGKLTTDSGFECVTGELPWRDNKPNVSCIPAGRYTCSWRNSPKHGMCYHVDGVPGRTDVEIHAANLMGDESQGWIAELKGCIAPGIRLGAINDQKAVLGSRPALKAFEDDLDQEPFELTIVEDFQ